MFLKVLSSLDLDAHRSFFGDLDAILTLPGCLESPPEKWGRVCGISAGLWAESGREAVSCEAGLAPRRPLLLEGCLKQGPHTAQEAGRTLIPTTWKWAG